MSSESNKTFNYLEAKAIKFDEEFDGECHGEEDVEVVEHSFVPGWLLVVLEWW